MARLTGIEPATSARQADVLPNYTTAPKIAGMGV